MNFITRLITIFLLFVFTQAVQSVEIQPRIIGGQQADNGEWPATVGLLLTANYSIDMAAGQSEGEAQYQAQFCGGTLLTPKWVLTAAHCVDNFLSSDVNVLAGVTNLSGLGQRIAVSKIVIDNRYDPNGNEFDIALLELGWDATSPATSIGLYNGDPAVGSDSTVVGWGTMSTTSAFLPRDLQEVVVQVVSNSDCDTAYNNSTVVNPIPITDNMVCAAASGKDSCQGDSGGPLMAEQGGVFKQIGVVSFGQGCAVPGFPGVYTRVDRFSSWINTVISTVNSAPVLVTISAPTVTATNMTNYTVAGTCTISAGDATVSIAGATPNSQLVACTAAGTWETAFNVSAITDGARVIDIHISQTDAAGNTGYAPLVEVNKDSTVSSGGGGGGGSVSWLLIPLMLLGFFRLRFFNRK